ncbi:AAA family ATPase [Acinetobacter sp. 1125_18A]|uniref:AAA family ATPase n=1 Tax=Acinetobacter sp. 1125_18A TaxID=2605959 RepID=UPI004058AF2F
MTESEKLQIYLPQEFPEVVNVLIGENGSGKSIALNQLAQRYVAQNYNVIAIANCLFDKFTFKSSYFHFIGARDGSKIIENTINNILNETYISHKKGNEKNQFILREAFQKIGYDPTIGFAIEIWNERQRLSTDEEQDFLYRIFKDKENLILFEDYIHGKNNIKVKNLYGERVENIFWFDFDSTSHFNNKNRINFDILNFLDRLKVVKIKFYFKNKKIAIPVEEASSGQLHLLFNILFIASTINKNDKKTVILIDEPESSLHPRWQKTYLENIIYFFYRYDIKMIVATHSPLIISSLDNIRPAFSNRRIDHAIYEVKNHKLKYIKEDKDKSIESIFWEAFGVITPESSFLARHIVSLIHDVNDRYKTKEAVLSELRSIKKLSFDERQINAINEAILIIERKF